ncbi:UDP-N-acetylglucosamine transferase [Serinicoccus hydrothermalis]|uniref:UDP-N-acetylglucosamine--N-acetylmuramyl-(pentapeptide) pyrophosphoryl-undecaprenol N-acetylglucosamine transferase n=1 Tax=Serinicoccus hydrothermalis TaxID=1758689 RepID=A0A1B1NA38_9MICO|nr:undecaprenyldiphospho-muramoylpentapeptide beta-N-acetylglucosaminyltransferase [Serinicoccus hydrothermalis]ANS78274.1 UDP-N-acetylglucosamine transferase [Serinicoccus hydrothermalis]
MSAAPQQGARRLGVVLAGGGSAGHVNPLLATADALRRRVPDSDLVVLGTAEGLEARLVPERGYELTVVPKVPFPRRPDAAVVRFPGSLRRAVATARGAMRSVDAQVVVGFGGYVATPAYLAARRAGIPIVIHEQNARPGLANRLGARFTPHVATTFDLTRLPHATRVGLPLREEIRTLDRAALRAEGLAEFGLEDRRPTLLVFGGSLGAQRLNAAFAAAGAELLAAGVQVLHLTGAGKDVSAPAPDAATGARYVARPYTDRMDLAYAVADLAVGRSGAGTVCELAAVGLPAVYVPLPVGNGEQRLNARGLVQAGGGMVVEDAQVTPEWVRDVVLPLVQDEARLEQMAAAAAAHGDRDAADRLVDLVLRAAAEDPA